MDTYLKRLRTNVETQSKKLKALREASIEKLRASTGRRSISPGKDTPDQIEAVRSFAVSQGPLMRISSEKAPESAKKELIAKEKGKSPLLKEKTTPRKEKSPPKTQPREVEENSRDKDKDSTSNKESGRAAEIEVEGGDDELTSVEDYAKKILEVIEKTKQNSRAAKLKKIKGLLKKLTKTNDEKLTEFETSSAKYKQQSENLKQKCDSTTKIISELEGKLIASEKEKVELRLEKESFLDKFSTISKELNIYHNQYFVS